MHGLLENEKGAIIMKYHTAAPVITTVTSTAKKPPASAATVIFTTLLMVASIVLVSCSSTPAEELSDASADLSKENAYTEAALAERELPQREGRNMNARTKASMTREDQADANNRNHLADTGVELQEVHGLPNNTLTSIEVDGDVAGATATARVEPYGYLGKLVDGSPDQIVVRIRSWSSSNAKVQAMDVDGRNAVLRVDADTVNAAKMSAGGQYQVNLIVKQEGSTCTFSIASIK